MAKWLNDSKVARYHLWLNGSKVARQNSKVEVQKGSQDGEGHRQIIPLQNGEEIDYTVCVGLRRKD